MDPNWVEIGPSVRTKVLRETQTVYNRNLSLHVLGAKFQFLCICCSRFYLEETTTFFWLSAQLGSFWVFRAINPVNNIRLSWNLTTDSPHSCTNASLSILKKSIFYRDLLKSLSFWSNFNPNLIPEDSQNQK